MELIRPDRFDVVLAAGADPLSERIAAALSSAGYRVHQTGLDLLGLKETADIKPNALVLTTIDDRAEEWVLNFVDGNAQAPAIVAVTDAEILIDPPRWLYDIVSADQVDDVLAYRLNLAIQFTDMQRLADSHTEKLGLSKAQIGMISMVDVATGLFNRRYFEKHLRESFAAANRYERPLTCLVVRIDNWSKLAIQFGTDGSNDVLDEIALALNSVIRQADTAARVDDDLFGFLLPETPPVGAQRLIERLLERFENTTYPHQAEVMVSAGFAQLSAELTTPMALLNAAITALA